MIKFDGNYPPTRIQNIEDLSLDGINHQKIKNFTYENRMDWELWAESATDYNSFKQAARSRGYTNLDMNPTPKYKIKGQIKSAPVVKTMLRKKL